MIEHCKTLKIVSKLKWKRELAGIKIPHRKVGCENCDESKKFNDCTLKEEMNCFVFEMIRSCQDCLSKITRTAQFSVESNKLKQQHENDFGYMLPYYIMENNIVIEKPVQKEIEKCSKGEKKILKIILNTKLLEEIFIMESLQKISRKRN